MSYKILLLNPQAANDCELEAVAYEFFTKAYLLYEEEISVSEFRTRQPPSFCKIDLDAAFNFFGVIGFKGTSNSTTFNNRDTPTDARI